VKAGRAQAETRRGADGRLQHYLVSLLYLSKEAEHDGLDAVAAIIWDAVAAIEAWLDTGNAPARSAEVLDSSLCHSLEFLLKWLALPAGKQVDVLRTISDYESPPEGAGVPVHAPEATRVDRSPAK